ncbi:MAG: LytTR family DNA-binding domain-containing protein [Pseudomonadota bacterium]
MPGSSVFGALALKGLFVLILGIALGVAGPYGTYGTVPVAQRLAFWIIILLVPWAIWETLFGVARRVLPKSLGARTLMALLMPAFAVIGSVFATSFSAGMFGLNGLSFAEAWAQSLASWLLFSFLIVLPLAMIADEISRREQRKGGENLLGFFALKLRDKLRGATLIALQSEGHYLRVYTDAGDDLVLMSMEDAMAALSAYPGIRTHRSWWVAIDQIISDFQLDAGSTQIPTRSGLAVPVSRRRRGLVRERLTQLQTK